MCGNRLVVALPIGDERALTMGEDVVLLGSAIHAATAAGLAPDLGEAARTMQTPPREIMPDPALSDYYAGQYRRLEILQACRQALSEAYEQADP